MNIQIFTFALSTHLIAFGLVAVHCYIKKAAEIAVS